ncbi:hypothetical protein Tsubulata_011472 [Turnera subulata]|uniref:Ribosome-inactivating protein n=1 Tax=Turnera subulata TaxID=218843 RepID=A0A9Q0JQM7_9ROSI|nr:hypothetical protein Tsubulata_011472 [Turnera subulata]
MRMMMMKFSKVAWVFLILVLVAGAGRVWPFGISGVEQLQQDGLSGFSTQFTLNSLTTPAEFARFIIRIRSLLTTRPDPNNWGFLRMTEDIVTGIRRYALIRIRLERGGVVTLVINTNDLYVAGFHSNNPRAQPPNAYFYLMEDDKTRRDGFRDAVGLFEGATAVPLGYEVQYDSLAQRSSVRLGRESLIGAITPLYHRTGDQPKDRERWPHHIVVIAEMISECVRSNRVLGDVLQGFVTGFYPDSYMIWVENHWQDLSDAVRNADHRSGNLNLPEGRELTPSGSGETIRDIWFIILHGLVTVLNKPRQPRTNFPPHDHLLMIMQQQNHHMYSMAGEEEEEEEEITTRIAGPNGTCVDVPRGEYHDGAEVFLWPCKSDDNPNQLWTFKKDGTIRSNNYCLKTYGGCPSHNYIMLIECPEHPSDTFAHWELRQDGTILHYLTGLVLTARSAAEGSLGTLTVDVDKKAPGQGWVATKHATTTTARIEWLPGRCLSMMSSEDYKVVLADCEGSGLTNQWSISWHRSIQIGWNNWGCLGCKSDTIYGRQTTHCEDGSDIVVQACCFGLPSQRWEVNGDGRIKNPEAGLYLTVANSGDDRVIAAPLHDEEGSGLTQTWFFKLN